MKGRSTNACPRGQADPAVQAVGGRAAAQGHPGAAQALTSALERIATLHADLARTHADLARAYDDLRGNAENGLAALAEQSVHALVPATTIEPEFVTDKQVGEMLKVSPRTVHRMAEEGRLPAPVRISPGRVRWRLRELEEWFAGADDVAVADAGVDGGGK